MTFTLSDIAQSLAEHIAPVLPDVVFFEDPNQQGTTLPCMFLQQRYARTTLQPGGRYLQKIGLDLTYLEDYNLPDMQVRYQQAAQTLDLIMETFSYFSDGQSALLRTYDREWRIDLDALHYQFEIRVLVSRPETPIYMRTIEQYTEAVKSVENKTGA